MAQKTEELIHGNVQQGDKPVKRVQAGMFSPILNIHDEAFWKKWACYNVPMNAAQPNGYDVIMASGMVGFLLPEKIDEKSAESITLLSDNQFWNNCQKSIERSLKWNKS